MKRTALIIFCFLSIILYGQEKSIDELYFRSNLKINPIRVLVDEAVVTLELPLGSKYSVEIGAGYIWSNLFLSAIASSWSTTDRFYHSGFMLEAGMKRYNIDNNRFFKLNLSYKNKSFDNIRFRTVAYVGSYDSYSVFYSRQLQQYRLQCVFGQVIDNKLFAIETYYGLGVMLTKRKTQHHGCDNCEFHHVPYEQLIESIGTANRTYLVPTIHIGLKVMLKFKKDASN